MTKTFTLEEVSKHKKQGDLWLVVRKKVYDLTKFSESHPGGEEVLIDSAGRDATQDFDDVGHSEEASKMMEEYYIGDLDPNSAPVKKETKTETSKLSNVVPTEKQTSGGSSFLVPVILVGLSIAAYFVLARSQ